ncbi:MAG: SAM-dependent methyltransferase, partial [Acidimicrobiia bacterium]
AGLGVGPVDLAVLAGNVMIFVPPASEGRVLANVAAAVRPGGLVVAGFQLHAGGLDVATYDRHADAAGLRLVDRYATWDRAPFTGPPAPYAVSVHRRS